MRINDPRIRSTTIQGTPVTVLSVRHNIVFCYSRPVVLGSHRLMRPLIFSPPASIRLIYDVFQHRCRERVARSNAGHAGMLNWKIANEFQDFAAVTRDRFGLRIEQHVEHRDHPGPGEAVGTLGKPRRSDDHRGRR